mmetsp:Transcript_134393/g.233599  ORF Transcript_134393/g.233599 Transcript_134393/m.233599 type:complete len:310 (+) Transcript_134393:584-1513(+)
MPWFGSASTHLRITSRCSWVVPCSNSKARKAPHASPRRGFKVTARLNHLRALAFLLSRQNSLATAMITWASFSHFFRASTLFAFCPCFGSSSIAFAQRMPLVGHSCNARLIKWCANLSLPSNISTSTPFSHKRSAPGFRRRPFSSKDRALVYFCCLISHSTAHSQRGTLRGHFCRPRSKNLAASCNSGGDFSMWICPPIIHIFANVGCSFRPSSHKCKACWKSPCSLSSCTDCIQTFGVLHCCRALASSSRLRWISLFSLSSFTAAKWIASDSLEWEKASARILRAAATSPRSHFCLAAMSHRISAWGQ